MSVLQEVTDTAEESCTLRFEAGEIINIDKPEGWTSFDVVKKIRGMLSVRKVGHAGTLDPFATGVLLVCTGPATKKVAELMLLDKEYEGVLELGKSTDTYDCTGLVTQEKIIDHLEDEEIQLAFKPFRGEIFQRPPMYSALKINGQRLYKLARKGLEIERPMRLINIYQLDLLELSRPFVKFRVRCSKGTYIRSLAHDIGQKLGVGATLVKLTRTRIGNYSLGDAYRLSRFVELFDRRQNH